MEFNRRCSAGRKPGGQGKKQTEPDTIAGSEHRRVRYCPGKQPQRAVLSAQQVISEIKTPQHIETSPDDADSSNHMVVHLTIVSRLSTFPVRQREPKNKPPDHPARLSRSASFKHREHRAWRFVCGAGMCENSVGEAFHEHLS